MSLGGRMVLRRWCDCPIRETDAWHYEDCPMTPIYAGLAEEIDSAHGLLHDLTLAVRWAPEQIKMWWGAL